LKTPRVTICVPARNAAITISRTLDSILAQDYPNYEVFVCDNSSTDNTIEIVKGYQNRGVRYYINPDISGGAEANWNYALNLAEGPLVAIYHADDIYAPDMVRKQVEFMQVNSSASAVFTMSERINEKDQPIRVGNLKLPKEFKGQDLFSFPELFNAVLKYGTITIVPTMMARKSILDKVGNFDWQQFYSASDIDLYLRIAKIGPIGIIDEPLHKYRLSPTQGSNSINKTRTHLAHFFWVLDAWLSNNENNQVVKPINYKIYKLNRVVDQISSAKNLLIMGKHNQAGIMLIKELKLTHFFTAFQQPVNLTPLIGGIIMLVSIKLGLGTLSGKFMEKAKNLKSQWQLKPVKK